MAPADPKRTSAADKNARELAETAIQDARDQRTDIDVLGTGTPKSSVTQDATGALEQTRAKAAATNALPKSGTPKAGQAAAPATQALPAQPSAKPASGSAPQPSAGEEAKKPKKVNQVGDFRLEKKLGQGGMGTVYLATQISLDRKVALKTLSPEFAKKPDFVKRFIREARSMARLQHPNVVQVYAADSASGVNYAAIEFIDGRSMQAWMDELGQLNLGDALHVILVCADALKHAHDQNMIHRDIKPDNILVTRKGVVKVADFGLAKALDEDVSMTQSGTGLGTPLYMAPEQARNAKHVDKRSDIYALGCTLYYFLTGKLPFTGENTLELITAKEKGAFTHARKLNPQVPERLDLMIDKMLMKDPNHRYADCGEIMRDLGGLGVANPALSFIDSTSGGAVVNAAVAVASGVGTSRMGATRGTGPAATQATTKPASPVSSGRLTSAEDAARSTAKSVATGKMWFVQHKGPDGKPVVSRMSTPEVMAGIKGETLDPAAKAKDNPNGTFLPLAQYAEFEALASYRAAKLKADARSRKTQDIYNKLDKQEQRRKRWRFLRRWVSNFKDLVVFLVYIAVLLALVGAGYYALTHLDDIRARFNGSPQGASQSAPQAAPQSAPQPAPQK